MRTKIRIQAGKETECVQDLGECACEKCQRQENTQVCRRYFKLTQVHLRRKKQVELLSVNFAQARKPTGQCLASK